MGVHAISFYFIIFIFIFNWQHSMGDWKRMVSGSVVWNVHQFCTEVTVYTVFKALVWFSSLCTNFAALSNER